MTGSDPEVTSFDLEVAVEGRKLTYNLRFTSYQAVSPGGGNHVTGNGITSPHVTGSEPKVT